MWAKLILSIPVHCNTSKRKWKKVGQKVGEDIYKTYNSKDYINN